MPMIDLSGKTFGRLTVQVLISRATHRRHNRWICDCSCGFKGIIVQGTNLIHGHTTSCGCVQAERASLSNKTHGHCGRKSSRSPEYQAWQNIIRRCTNIKATGFKYYGGRGISVDPRWMKSFTAFLNDMGLRPSSNYSVERNDVNGNYEPSNCRWATRKDQAANRRQYCTLSGFSTLDLFNELLKRVAA